MIPVKDLDTKLLKYHLFVITKLYTELSRDWLQENLRYFVNLVGIWLQMWQKQLYVSVICSHQLLHNTIQKTLCIKVKRIAKVLEIGIHYISLNIHFLFFLF